ncbi:MAG TPA: D-alanyl-D-alanine carboxypeptidase [Pyrinomonadaceae bacterium]|jgi:D-alanyl-D-alanine carboxypeptidase/D-alanyl-D-alanine-endopeptidase (penicillin-binding protein 4)
MINRWADRKNLRSRLLAFIASVLLLSVSSSCVITQSSESQPATPPPPSAPATAIPVVKPEVDIASWYGEHDQDPETHAMLVETLAPGRVITSHNADKLFNPASIIKLVTSLAALRRLGPDYRFEVKVYADGTLDDRGVFHGQLYVMGGAPTFGDAAANMIAKELRDMGVKRLDGTLNVSQDFCFNFSNSPEESAERLIKALKLEGAQPAAATSNAPAGEIVLTFYSHPLREVLLYMNAHSSNFTAERVGNLIGGPAAVQQFLIDELKLSPAEVQLSTVSGREQNRMNARGIMTVLRALVDETRRHGMKPSDILPVADEDNGTLRRRFTGSSLEGAVLGKTGTLTPEVDGGMVSLAGIVYTEDAGELAFVMLDQGDRLAENRDAEDKLLEDVVRMRAQPRPVPIETPRDLLSASSMRVERRGALQKGRKAA